MVADAVPREISGFQDFYQRELARTVRSVEPIAGVVAEDVAQEAFIVAMGRWPEVAGLEAPGAWVRLVAHRMAWRRRSREAERTAREASASSLGAVRVDAETHLDLTHALRSLTSTQRRAVRMHYLADLPVSVIAEQLGSREATVRVWLHRARGQLAEALGGCRGRWVSDGRWTEDDIVRRLRSTGDGRHVAAVVPQVPTRRARWVFTLDHGTYDISTDEGEQLDHGRYRARAESIELTPWDRSGTIVLRHAIDGSRARFRIASDSTAPTMGVPDEVYLRLILEADGFMRAEVAGRP